jgi:hypothetical protein
MLAPVALIAAAVSCDRQAPAGVDDATPQPRFAKKPPADPIEVTTFDPQEGEQGQPTFPMTVIGSGFGNGAKVVFVLGEEDVSTIETTTTSVNAAGTELTADVTIGLEAVASEDYKVAVQLRRSRGVGTESFKVKVPPGQIPPGDPAVITFLDEAGHKIVSDNELRSDAQYSGPDYEDGVCGVTADLGNFDDARLNPDGDYRNGKDRKTCGDARFLTFIFDAPFDGGPPKDNRSDGIFMNIDHVRTETGTNVEHFGQFNLCTRLIFSPNDKYDPGNGSDLLLVSFDDKGNTDPADDEWTVRTKDFPNDKGYCVGDGRLWHMPFELKIRLK